MRRKPLIEIQLFCRELRVTSFELLSDVFCNTVLWHEPVPYGTPTNT